MNSCMWAPTSRHILTVSEFNLRLTIWSLVDKSVQYIEGPKQSGNLPAGEGRGIAFSPDRRIMALIEKNNEDARDMIGLYDLTVCLTGSEVRAPQNWTCMHRFFPETFDAHDIMFGQDNNHLLVWESPLKNSINVYQLIFTGVNEIADIRLVEKIEPETSGLGCRRLMLSPN